MRRILALAAVVALTGCTPAQLAAWLDWHTADPAAAVEFANRPEIQAELAVDRAGQIAAEATRSTRRVSVWDDIAWCESGGNWSHRPVTNSSGTYSGGLMIGHRWWPAYGGTRYASAPYLATKAQQIAVAENIAADVGLDRGWQCWP